MRLRIAIAAATLLLVAGGVLFSLRPFASDQSEVGARAVPAEPAAVRMPSTAGHAAVGSPRIASTAPVSRGVAESFAAFRDSTIGPGTAVPVDPLLAETSTRQAMESTEAPTIDYARAVPVHVGGSTRKAWIAPAGKKVCAVVEAANGADVGGGCTSVDQARAGGGLTMGPITTADGPQVLVLQVVVDGQVPGTVEAAGKAQPIGSPSAGGNAVAGVFPPSGVVRTGEQAFPLDKIREP